MKLITLIAVLIALAGSTTASASRERDARTTTTTVTVKGGEFYFKLSVTSITRPGTVLFVFKNVGHVLHDFQIAGKRTPNIQPGQTAKLTVTFRKAGSYPYQCTIERHAAAGMRGVFKVKWRIRSLFRGSVRRSV